MNHPEDKSHRHGVTQVELFYNMRAIRYKAPDGTRYGEHRAVGYFFLANRKHMVNP